MFALALWDQREQVLQLARDRFGEKPLYVGLNGSSPRQVLLVLNWRLYERGRILITALIVSH